MNYKFLETMDISEIENNFLNKYYNQLIDNFDISLYKLFVNHSVDINYVYTNFNVTNALKTTEKKVKNSLNNLIAVNLVEIFKQNEIYIIKLNKIKINQDFFESGFLENFKHNFINPVNYNQFSRVYQTTNTNKKSFDLNTLELFLKPSGITLSEKDIKIIDATNKVFNINIFELSRAVGSSYDRNLKKLNVTKFNNSFNQNKIDFKSIKGDIKNQVIKYSKNNYADLDLINFSKILQKHQNINDDQLHAIIKFSYETQDNIYFNFIDKLAVSLIKSNKNTFDEAYLYLVSYNKNNFKTKNKKNNSIENTKPLNWNELKRTKDAKATISLEEILGKDK